MKYLKSVRSFQQGPVLIPDPDLILQAFRKYLSSHKVNIRRLLHADQVNSAMT